MKFLKYLLGIIAVLVIIFFLLGMIKSEISYTNEIEVNKPLSEAWAVSQDESKMKDWLEGLQKVEHVSGIPGTVGSVSDIYFINEGQEMVIRETITEIVPNESVSMTFTSEFMDMDYKLSMSSKGNKTKINSITTCKGNGMLSKSLIAMMGGTMESQEQTNLESLKKTIENNSVSYE